MTQVLAIVQQENKVRTTSLQSWEKLLDYYSIIGCPYQDKYFPDIDSQKHNTPASQMLSKKKAISHP